MFTRHKTLSQDTALRILPRLFFFFFFLQLKAIPGRDLKNTPASRHGACDVLKAITEQEGRDRRGIRKTLSSALGVQGRATAWLQPEADPHEALRLPTSFLSQILQHLDGNKNPWRYEGDGNGSTGAESTGL